MGSRKLMRWLVNILSFIRSEATVENDLIRKQQSILILFYMSEKKVSITIKEELLNY